ncbi:MAG: insulinase family protein [Bacteroidaceae bacterium]|nr:insulinase family protein [Bacteroidaceae bacterium]
MKRLLFTFASLFVAIVAFGQTPLPSDPAVKVGKLENGLTYYIRHNALPEERAEFYLATNVGAFQETDDQDGLAHFLEHMCFNGTKNFPGKAILDYLQSIGAEFGRNINASTGFEQTSYMLNNIPVVREGVIDSCLMILRDYSCYVTCAPEEIDAERGVILEERRSRRNADWRMLERSLPYYFGDTQMARRTLIGGEEQLKSFKYESLTNFYRTWYKPDMQAVIVVGDIDVDQIEAKIKAIFGEVPAPEQPTVKPVIPIPDNDTPQVAVLTDPESTNSMIEVLWRIPRMPREYRATDAAFVSDLMYRIIGLVMDERFKDITSKTDAPFLMGQLMVGGLCESSDAVQGSVMFKDGEALPAFEAYMLEVEKMLRYGFTESEVERAKQKIISRLEKRVTAADSRKSSELVYPILDQFFAGDYNIDPATELQLTQAILAQLPAAVFQQVLPQLIGTKNNVIISKAPEREGLVQPTVEAILAVLAKVKNAEIAAPVEEASNEPLLDASALKGAKSKNVKEGVHGATTWKLSNGVNVVVLPTEHKKDQVIIDLVEEGGLSLVENGELASLDDNVWGLFLQNRGLSTFSGTQLKKMLAGKNVHGAPYINSLRHGVSMESTPKDIETAFQLIYLNYMAPRFDNDEFKLGITQLEAILPNLLPQPDFKFQEVLMNTLYANNPRRGVISMETLAAANIGTLESVYRRLFDGVNGATLYIVGNVNVDSVKPLIEKYIGSIKKGKKASEWVDRKEYFAQGNVVEHPTVAMETPKTTVFQFYSADVPYSVKDEVMLDAAKQILDMVFTETLRESEGGTYGAGVAVIMNDEPKEYAGIQVAFETNPEQAASLVALAKQGVLNLVNEGIPADKLDNVKKNMLKNIPENRISNRYWLTVLKEWKKNGSDYDKLYADAVSQVTAENVLAVLKAILASDNYIEIVMSPAE